MTREAKLKLRGGGRFNPPFLHPLFTSPLPGNAIPVIDLLVKQFIIYAWGADFLVPVGRPRLTDPPAATRSARAANVA